MGYADCPYDALLDDFEPDELTANVRRVLADLREQLVPLVAAIGASSRRPNGEIFKRSFPVDRQEAFGKQAATAIGFDFSAGRVDVTAHPFCTTLGPRDCRITTRYHEDYFPAAFFGTLHESGHGMYEQGLPPEKYGLPTGEAISLGVHESQSRMWENLVGRSLSFWKHFYPEAQKQFPQVLNDVSLEDFYFAVNNVRPSLIRIEADEATYNLHILIRFELEQDLLDGKLSAADAPEAWHEKYRKYLGVSSPTDADGVLQDVHWSAGLIGYFPTYSLGNLYAAQYFEQARKDLGDLDAMFARGEFQPLLAWLRENIHRHGQRVHRRRTSPTRHRSAAFARAADAAFAREVRDAVWGLGRAASVGGKDLQMEYMNVCYLALANRPGHTRRRSNDRLSAMASGIVRDASLSSCSPILFCSGIHRLEIQIHFPRQLAVPTAGGVSCRGMISTLPP